MMNKTTTADQTPHLATQVPLWRRLRRAALLAALTLTAPLIVVGSAEAAVPMSAQSSDECREGSRDIDVSYPRDIARAVIDGGSQGRSEITLRSNGDGSCHWGLINGYGQIWLERSSAFGGVYDGFWNPKKNTRDGITHTAATVTTEHAVRACGNAFNGEVSSSSGWDVGASLDGRRPGLSIGYNSDNQRVYSYADGTVCTEWHGPDMYISNSF